MENRMAALTTQQEYDAIREAIQKLSTLNTDGSRRDLVSFSVDGQRKGTVPSFGDS